MSRFDRVEIPYGAYWSTPFAKWQGSLQHLHSLKLAAHVTKLELQKRGIAPETFDFGVLGTTITQYQSFYGAVWPFYEIGMRNVAGPTVSQACASGARVLLTAAAEIQLGMATTALALGADRLSNGPHIYYPSSSGLAAPARARNKPSSTSRRMPWAATRCYKQRRMLLPGTAYRRESNTTWCYIVTSNTRLLAAISMHSRSAM